MWPSPALDLYPNSIVLDARGVALDRLLSRPSQHISGRDVELAAVAGTGHDGTFKIALGKRALEVRTRIAEGVKRSAHIRDRDAHSPDVERRQLALSDPSCV